MDTAAKHLVDDLLTKGIDTYFGIPGGPISPLFDAVLRTKKAQLIESKHETAAVFEAIGYYKSTGKVPVVLLGGGPGMTNALTGIASAKALRIPLIVITGDVAWEKSKQILLQQGGPDGIDIEKTFAPHTYKVLRLHDPLLAPQQVMQAIENNPGTAPLLVVFPFHISKTQIDKPFSLIESSNKKKVAVDSNTLSSIATKIANAKHPLLVIGYGARNSVRELTDLINTLNIPFVSTPQAKGIIPDTHPLSLRHSGLAASQWIRAYLETTPDVLLVLGTDLDDCAVGTVEFANDKTEVIHVDLNPKVFNRKYINIISVIADIKMFSAQLSSVFFIKKLKSTYNPKEFQYSRSLVKYDVLDPYWDDSLPIAPHRALLDIQSAVKPGYRYVTDIGEHMLFCLHYLTIHKGDDFSIDLGLGSMGSGICSAIGMTLGDRKPTFCIVGDGGMQMHGMEILTAIKHKLPIIFVVFNDARYNMVYHGFKFLFEREENLGETDYIDFTKFAQAIGARGMLIDYPGQIDSELVKDLFLTDGPVILDVRINKDIRIKGAGRNEALKHMGEFSE
jgi:acetolactate synthase-1/2/3 large subunit